MVRRRVIPAFALLPALALLPAVWAANPASAQQAAATSPIEALATTVGNLGYETKMGGNGKNFSINIRSAYNFTINFSYSNDGTLVWMSANVATYTPEQLPQLNTVRLMELSDPGPSYFVLAKGDTSDTLYAQRSLPAQAATPVLLRNTIDNISNLINNNDAIWNKNLWK